MCRILSMGLARRLNNENRAWMDVLAACDALAWNVAELPRQQIFCMVRFMGRLLRAFDAQRPS